MTSKNASPKANPSPPTSSPPTSSPTTSSPIGAPGSPPGLEVEAADKGPLAAEKWLTSTEAARLRGVTRAAIYKAVEQGRLSHQRILGRIAVREADVLAWAAAGAKPGRPKGIPMTSATKSLVAQAQRRRWAKSND